MVALAPAAVLVAIAGLVSLASATAEQGEHPIQGVISLLEKLQVEAHKEGAAEAESFQKFQYWCKRSTRRLTRAIKKEKKKIDELTDKIEGLASDIATVDDDIKDLDAQLDVLDKQAKKAEKLRAEEHAIYEEDVQNLGDSIMATDEALEVMEEAEGEGGLLQTGSGRHHQKKAAMKAPVDELMKMDPGKDNPFKPKAKVFSNHAGGAIEQFKALEDGWSIDKLSEEEQETNALNAYKLAKQARDTAIKTAEDAKAEKESVKSESDSEKATAESDKQEEERALEGDTSLLTSTDTDCTTKTQEFDERTKTRAGEIEAMAVAIRILEKVSGVRNPDTHEIPTKSLMAVTARVEQDTSDFSIAVSFLQKQDPKAKVMALLRKAAAKVHSKALEKLADKIKMFEGPFDKIKQMIEKMVFRLMGEQKDEDDHKLWCDDESAKSTDTKEEREDKVKVLKLKISEMDTAIKLIVKQITENNEKVATLTDYIKTETEIRDENHNEIMLTIKDAQDAQEAISQAVTVLKEFYKKSGMIPKEPWEFVQTSSGSHGVDLPEQPSTWEASYTGVSDPASGSDGILTIMDEAMQKFTTMEADAKVQDETDQKDYEGDMAAKKADMDETNADTQQKNTRKDSLQEKMEGTALTLKHTSVELDAVLQYMKDLEPACGKGDSTYDDRKKARADEIEALKKAQTILEDAFKAKAFLQK